MPLKVIESLRLYLEIGGQIREEQLIGNESSLCI